MNARKLEPASMPSATEDDGPLYSFDDAPMGEPFTEAERDAFEAAVTDIHSGRAHTIPGEQVTAELAARDAAAAE